jgi:hypothetical protein
MTAREITAAVIGVVFAAMAVWPSIRSHIKPTTRPEKGDQP